MSRKKPSKKFVLGNRYQLPHGIGKLIGREIVDENKKISHSFTSLKGYKHARYIFELEDPNTWAFNGHRYFTGEKSIKELTKENK